MSLAAPTVGARLRALPSPVKAPVLVALALLGAAAAAVDGWHGVGLTALAALVGAGLLMEVHLPWGGRVPLGHAVVIALAELLPRPSFAFVVAVALLGIWPAQAARHGARRGALLVGWLGVAATAAALAQTFGLALTDAQGPDEGVAVLLRVTLAGVAYLAVDLLSRGPLAVDRSDAVLLRQAWPMELALLCAAALLAVVYRTNGATLALLAAVPLVVTRFSFERYSVARHTYEQTTQALGIVPEVAGLVPLGHAERTAAYAGALAHHLGLDPAEQHRVVTAARLHHIGHISLHEPEMRTALPDQGELGRIGAEILEETGFLHDVAQVVEAVGASDPHFAPLPVAIVRVSSTFDDLVADDPRRARQAAVELLLRHSTGVERSVAIAFLRLTDTYPALVAEAVARGEPLTSAAADDHDHDGHDCR